VLRTSIFNTCSFQGCLDSLVATGTHFKGNSRRICLSKLKLLCLVAATTYTVIVVKGLPVKSAKRFCKNVFLERAGFSAQNNAALPLQAKHCFRLSRGKPPDVAGLLSESKWPGLIGFISLDAVVSLVRFHSSPAGCERLA